MERFVQFHKKSPDLLGVKDIKDYQFYLTKEKKLNPRSINRETSAVYFFYTKVLGKNWQRHLVPRMKTKDKLPVILSVDEIRKMISVTKNIKHKAMLMTLYSTGIRLSEVKRLRPNDIDSKRMVINIRDGKGGADRQAILSINLLNCLRKYWVES